MNTPSNHEPAPAAGKPTEPGSASASATNSRHGIMIAVFVLGFLLLGCVPIAGLGLAWYFGSDAKKSAKGVVVGGKIKDEQHDGKWKEPPKRVDTPHEKRVKETVQRAAAYLKKGLLDGTAPKGHPEAPFSDTETGIASLIGLALLEAGMPPEDPAVRMVLEKVRKVNLQLNSVYVLSTVLLFLNRLNEKKSLMESDRGIIRRLALRLITGQIPSGQWSYATTLLGEKRELQLVKDLQTGKYKPMGVPSTYPSSPLTQFAILALWGARKAGVPVSAPLLRASHYYRKNQLPDGGWGYNNMGYNTTNVDSGTCAGLLALAMEEAIRHDREFNGDPMPPEDPKLGNIHETQRKGFVRLGKAIDRKKDDPRPPSTNKLFGAGAYGDCYFLWGVERVALIYGKPTIESKDWYQWGSEILIKTQQKDGGWIDRFHPAIDTAFAIFFLARANLATDLTESMRSRR